MSRGPREKIDRAAVEREIDQALQHGLASIDAANRAGERTIQHHKSAGASVFEALKEAAGIAGLPPPPSHPKAFWNYYKSASLIPAFTAALKTEGMSEEDAARIIEWHVDFDVAMYKHATQRLATLRRESKPKRKVSRATLVRLLERARKLMRAASESARAAAAKKVGNLDRALRAEVEGAYPLSELLRRAPEGAAAKAEIELRSIVRELMTESE